MLEILAALRRKARRLANQAGAVLDAVRPHPAPTPIPIPVRARQREASERRS